MKNSVIIILVCVLSIFSLYVSKELRKSHKKILEFEQRLVKNENNFSRITENNQKLSEQAKLIREKYNTEQKLRMAMTEKLASEQSKVNTLSSKVDSLSKDNKLLGKRLDNMNQVVTIAANREQ